MKRNQTAQRIHWAFKLPHETSVRRALSRTGVHKRLLPQQLTGSLQGTEQLGVVVAQKEMQFIFEEETYIMNENSTTAKHSHTAGKSNDRTLGNVQYAGKEIKNGI